MMTTLQIVLAIVGIGMIAAIVIYNLVQEQRFRRDADRLFLHKRDDIILGESVRTDTGREQGETRIQLTGREDSSPEARHAVEEAVATLHMDNGNDDFALSRPQATASHGSQADAWDDLPPVREVAPAPEPPVPPVPPVQKKVVETAKPAPRASPQDAGYLPPHIASLHESSAKPAGETAPRQAPAKPQAAGKTGEPTATLLQPASGLDIETEFIARLKFATPSFTSYTALLGSLRRIGKPVRAFGQRPDGVWEAVSANPRDAYGQMELGMQLADRSGAVAQDQLDAFCRALYTFAADAGGAVSCANKDEALAKAHELDLFCMDVDVLMGLNVVASESHPFTSEAIHTQAGAAGMKLEREGSYHARTAAGHTLFTLSNQEEVPFPADGRGLTTRGVTLLLDVPRVADGLAVFDRMTDFGHALADRLDGRLVDDNGRGVSTDSLNRDRARLADYFGRMSQRGIPAGGERANRLFA